MNDYVANKLAALATAVADRLAHHANEGRSATATAMILTLHHGGPLTASALARLIQISQPSAARVADGLVREGLVERAEKRAREVDLSLTAMGRAEAQRLQSARLARASELLTALEPDELAAFEAAVDRLLRAATDGRATARRLCRYCAHDICRGPRCPVGSRATELDGETGGTQGC